MKKVSDLIKVSTMAMMVAVCLIGCGQKESESDECIPSQRFSEKSAPAGICCQVKCSNGSCCAYGTACDCHCTLLGYPVCITSETIVPTMPDSLFDGRVHVSLSSDVVENTTRMKSLLVSFRTPYASTAAALLDDMISCVNTYGLTLATREGVREYYTIAKALEGLESQFSMLEIKQIGNLLDTFGVVD